MDAAGIAGAIDRLAELTVSLPHREGSPLATRGRGA
jgi:hypothetical protein